MRTISASAFLALAVLAAGSAARAQERVIPDVGQIEQLCPQIGLNGFRLGAVEASAHWADLAGIEAQAPAPLDNASLLYTAWSNRLAAITWDGPGFDGMENFPWAEGIAERLEGAGWVLHGEGDSLFEPAEYRKEIATADGPRTFAVTFASNGNFELTCGDAALLDLSAAEAVGDLPDGSPRPLPPPAGWAGEADAWLARFDCADPAFIAQFAGMSELDETAAIVVARIGEPPAMAREGDYQRRLATWLAWKIRGSGKLSDEEFRALEERAVTYDRDEAQEDFAAFITAAAALIEARESGDGVSRCTAAHGLFADARASGEREAARTARANAIRMAEARKLGIAID